jgi:hypothetical protein
MENTVYRHLLLEREVAHDRVTTARATRWRQPVKRKDAAQR